MPRRISLVRIALAVVVLVAGFGMYRQVTGRQQLDRITLPEGFHIAVYSSDVPNARQMALGTDGTVIIRKCADLEFGVLNTAAGKVREYLHQRGLNAAVEAMKD